MKLLRVVMLIILSTYYSTASAQLHVQNNGIKTLELNSNWEFRIISDSLWQKATVPGTVHTDLFNNKRIEDPFYRMNELDLQWIDKADWEYKTTFNLNASDLDKQKIEIEFEGLDTYSKVFLNGKQILETDNMFRTYVADVKPILNEGANELLVLFESPIHRGVEKYDSIDYRIPVSDNDMAELGQVEGAKKVSIFTRKAGYHYGWDWGTRLVTSGIWKAIRLKSWNNFVVKDLFIEQNKLDEKAELTAWVEVESMETANVKVNVLLEGNEVKLADVKLSKGMNKLEVPFSIDKPKLWWPNGLGEQNLYMVKVTVTSNKKIAAKEKRIGLRNIEIVRDPDSIGTSFYFKVNGHPVFMKGTNYIPQDAFLNRVSESDYKHILSSAKEANMNMIRVWGGGIYEKDEFYNMCDEMGLLVWQDFMFACAMFPGDDAFVENVRQEAIDNVKRLRNHTSIALWCGNNEVLTAWENWGWKNKVSKEQSKEIADKIWKAYEDIFHKVLPEVVNEYDGTKFYWASSPSSSLGVEPSNTSGDLHYWNVWWGKQPFDMYKEVIPRFMSEFGFQSFPTFSSVKRYTAPEDYDIYSDVMQSHQRSSIGNVTIDEYMKRHYKQPKDFENFLYVSQLLQAYGIRIGVEAHRRNMHDLKCMGSLYWQINDCWPVASWSSIDYYGKWKALHYNLKEAFNAMMISLDDRGDNISIYIVSDSLNDIKGRLKVQLLDFKGEKLKKWSKKLIIAANDAAVYFEIPKTALEKFNSKKLLLKATLSSNKKHLSERIFYLERFKDLELVDPEIKFSIADKGEFFEVTLRNKKHAIGVYLETENSGNFSENFFDMTPNSKKVLIIEKDDSQDLKQFKKSLKVYNLYSSF